MKTIVTAQAVPAFKPNTADASNDLVTPSKRVGLVHDWLPLYGGAERVLEQILHIFPNSNLYSLIDSLPAGERGFIMDKVVRTSLVQLLPFGKQEYRSYFPLMPLAVEQFDLSRYDIVISSSYAFAKGVLTGPDQLHICFCHSPVRYAWDLQHQYLTNSMKNNRLMRWFTRLLLHYVRLWDTRTANGVDHFVTNSHYVARRIRKVYRRSAEVIYPPVDVEAFTLQHDKDDFYFTASRMVPYKRIDLIVEAFAGMPEKQLIVIGDGPEFKNIEAKAGPNVKLLGFQSDEVLRDHMQRCRAFIFAAEEDFGITPVEAQACGTPVIAFSRGGATETILAGKTGVFFSQQTVPSVQEAVRGFEALPGGFSAELCRENAERFSVARFRREFAACVEREWKTFKSDGRGGVW